MRKNLPPRAAGAFLALVVIVGLTGLAATAVPRSEAATGTRVGHGEPWVGMLVARPSWLSSGVAACTVVAVSQYVALSAAHCGYTNVHVKLNATRFESEGMVVKVTKGIRHPTMDVEALFFARPTGLPVMERSSAFHQGNFSVWGYGMDARNVLNVDLTRADFEKMTRCVSPETGTDICWEVGNPAGNGVCRGDSGAPVTQDGRLIGIQSGVVGPALPNGRPDCARVEQVHAVSIGSVSEWVDQMILLGNPLP